MVEPKFETKTIKRVYDNSDGVYIEVGPDGDGLGLLEIRTSGKANIDYFGEICLCLQKEMMREIAFAIISLTSEEPA